jgi:uncharacterized protein (TIGR02599 family)
MNALATRSFRKVRPVASALAVRGIKVSAPPAGPGQRGFTLVEMLVATTILVLMMTVLFSVMSQTMSTWSYARAKTEQFRGARTAFESITRRLAQATLNTYWDYDDPNGPTRYVRQSELRFISGPGLAGTASTKRPTHSVFFQAPLGFVTDSQYGGLDNLLNTWGYYIEFGSDRSEVPAIIQGVPSWRERWRFRVFELMQPANQFSLYSRTSGLSGGKPRNLSYTGREWFNDALTATPPPVHVLAENVVALVLLPKLSPQDEEALQTKPTPLDKGTKLAPNYLYDSTSEGAAVSASGSDKGALNSKNQLPPIVQVTMVALDEVSAARLATQIDPGNSGTMPDLGWENLFQRAENYKKDLVIDPDDSFQSLEEALIANKLSYRIFTTEISIKAAKWSREQQ